MLTRVIRWFVIAAPALAGVLLLIFGTAGATSQAFGWTLIGIAALVWMSNVFIRMSFDEDKFEREAEEREQRATSQQRGLSHPPEPAVGPEGERDRAQEHRERPDHTPRPGAAGSGSRHPSASRLTRRPRRPT